jgi:VWFA-related protein
MVNNSQIRSALVALFTLTYLSAAQDGGDPARLPTYHSNVSEVRVTFFATGASNLPLETLTKSDFAVVDSNRVIRNFRSFTHSDETALDVVVLVDLSESVALRYRVAMNDVLQLVAREQSIANDSMAVLSFGGLGGTSTKMSATIRPALLCSSGCRAADSVAKLQAAKSGGLTPLFDGLIFASDYISHHRRAGVRPVLILFSDGNDTISLHSASDALFAVRDAGALIYSVDISASGKQASGGAFLQQVSEATGGRYFSPRLSANEGAAALLGTVLEDLRASYVVTYDLPTHERGFHALRLLPTHNLNLTFHSRNGYNYDPSDQNFVNP